MSMEIHYYYLERSDDDGGCCITMRTYKLYSFILYVICHFCTLTSRYGAETTYSRLRVSCSIGDVSRHLVNSGGVQRHKWHLCRMPFASPRKNSGIAPINLTKGALALWGDRR